jgi:hypothetical protein
MQRKLEDYQLFKPVIESMIQPGTSKSKKRSFTFNFPKRVRANKIKFNLKLPATREVGQQTIQVGFSIMKRRISNSKKQKRYSKELNRLKTDQSNYNGGYWQTIIVIE